MPQIPLINKAKEMLKNTSATKGKKKKKIIIACILIAVIIAGAAFGSARFFGKNDKKTIQTAVAAIGNVSNVIEGSGTIAAINQYEVTALVTGEILADYFQEGQMLNAGDLMYTIDSTEMENSIKKAQQSLEKSQLTYQESQKTLANLNVYSDVSGVITEMYVKKGDQIQSNTKIAEIINTDYMLLKIQFISSEAQQLYVGQKATVNLENSFTALEGEVTAVATGTLINADGVPVSNVEIKVANPGAVMPGERATAIVGSFACNAPGTFEYYETETVLAKTSGEIISLNYREGDKITAGSKILTLESDSATKNARQNQLSVQDAQVSLQDQYDKLDDYNITAPISGKVIQKTAKAGEKLDNSTNKSAMAIIADLSTLVFEISVDELDISNIKVGQTVQITADALSGKIFTGYVDNVSIVGTSSNGVTSYPVKVVVDNGEESGLIPGMNVNASIVVESRENVLTVPLSAINRGNIVYVKKDGNSAKNKDENKAESSNANDEMSKRGEMPEGFTPPEGMPERGEMPEGFTPPEGMPKTGEMPEGMTMPEGAQNTQNATNTENGDSAKSESASAAPKANSKNNDMQNKMLERMQAEAPDGFEAVMVVIGLSDDTNVEIISGLSEGDVVKLSDVTAASTTQNGMGMMGGMPGGMAGGMPPAGMAGGMSGGMSGGNRMPGGMGAR
ncbi:MAG: HlyD family efflux transporter periplasmic adaptor subunit [Clostridia bacterium]|nr:HlyD family efflux transporter periplasmic adaptor subunit [Clostridia bacterium]